MTTETSNARGERVLVPRVPTKAMIDAWRDAPDIWEDAYAAMLAAAPQPQSAPVWVDLPINDAVPAPTETRPGNLFLWNWTAMQQYGRACIAHALAQQPAAVDEAAAIRAFEEHFEASAEDPSFEGELELWLTAWRKALDSAPQQPAAVDGAMVERACDAYVQIADDCMGLVRRKAMAAALTAALAAQRQEPTT